MNVSIFELAGDFAEDKDVAATIREECIRVAVGKKNKVVLEFGGVTLVTQSFIHALISDVLRSTGEAALKYIVFKECNPGVRGIVETVVQYSLEALEEPDTAAKAAANRSTGRAKRKRLTSRSSRRGRRPRG
jgi:hypothetical protein